MEFADTELNEEIKLTKYDCVM